MRIAFDNTYGLLPAGFFVARPPQPVAAPRLIRVNDDLAEALGLDAAWLASAEGVQVLAGNVVPPGAQPIALAYAGHQFGQFVPQLGDGRAVLLGEVLGRDGCRRDIQLKGAGPTAFSRRGDGRAALGPVLREYLLSEAMAALCVPTTRALAAVTTGEHVLRDRPLPGAVFTRVAASHIRVGTFAYFAARGDIVALRTLADYAINRHDPHLAARDDRYLAFLQAVIARQADLIAQWLLVGFIHGVMNTDNMAISGETIDYGPCAFMDAYDPAAVFSSIDHSGRYAYGNQPRIAHWNLTRLAEALLPLLGETDGQAIAAAEEALAGFGSAFQRRYQAGLNRKIGLQTEQDGDAALTQDLLTIMTQTAADFTLTFHTLEHSAPMPWANRWRARLATEPGDAAIHRATMLQANPAFIARNHLVEEVIAAAADHADFTPFERLLDVLLHPFADCSGLDRYAAAPQPEERVLQTFCGT